MAKESSFKNMFAALLVTMLVSSALLAAVYELTKDAIAEVQIRKINAGILKVLPTFDNNPSQNISATFVDGDTVYTYAATKGEKLVGLAVQTFSNEGYSGKIVLVVGFLPDGTINNIDVVSHSETPGLGDQIEPKKNSKFSKQFHGQNPADYKLSVTKDGGNVDAISATTISSRAFCNAVARAYRVFCEEIKKHDKSFTAKAPENTNAVSGATATMN